MNTRFIIYCHTNKVNGKRYIGQTTGTMERRWGEHVAAAKRKTGCRILGAAIRKHRQEAFDHEVLETVIGTQEDADRSEANWISTLGSRSPIGYNLSSGGGGNGHHHEESKDLISKSSSERLANMTKDQRAEYFRKNIHVWTPERKERQSERCRSENTRKNISSKQKKFWSQFTAKEKSERVRHQLSGMSAEAKSDRVRKSWNAMTAEAREARVLKMLTSSRVTKSTAEHSKKMSEWQKSQARSRTPEQRRAIGQKSLSTRRAKYGEKGMARIKTSEEYSASAAKGWANMTPEARADRGLKMKEGRRLARESRRPRLVRINLLSPALQ
jgi:group I intron endonuclease